jgi:hypothetical protein
LAATVGKTALRTDVQDEVFAMIGNVQEQLLDV